MQPETNTEGTEEAALRLSAELGVTLCQKIICTRGRFKNIPLFTFCKGGKVIARVYWFKRKKAFKAYPEESNIFHASKLKDVRDILIDRTGIKCDA